VLPATELDQPLLGLRGITSRAGREAKLEPELLLHTDALWNHLPGSFPPPTPECLEREPVAALASLCWHSAGAEYRTAIALASPEARSGLPGVDLVVTGCSVFDFASRGGGVVAAMAEAASTALSPCILIAGEVVIGSREMRTMGIEAAYAVRESAMDDPRGIVNVAELAATARRVARSWTW
jgi:glycerate kinase